MWRQGKGSALSSRRDIKMGDSPAVILRGPEELIKERPIDRLIVDGSKKETPDKASSPSYSGSLL